MLRLRPYKKCDAKYIVGWIKDETAFRKWCADRYDKYPITAEDIHAHYVATDDTKRGKGYGKELLQLSIEYAFRILKVQKITLGVFENNETAYYCYKAVGFKDVLLNEYEYYHVLGEDWKCMELEIIDNYLKNI